jgi:hypothetical protein
MFRVVPLCQLVESYGHVVAETTTITIIYGFMGPALWLSQAKPVARSKSYYKRHVVYAVLFWSL